MGFISEGTSWASFLQIQSYSTNLHNLKGQQESPWVLLIRDRTQGGIDEVHLFGAGGCHTVLLRSRQEGVSLTRLG